MDWAEEKYDVCLTIFSPLKILPCCSFSKVTVAGYYFFSCDAETPDCSNQNGAEGPLLIHPTANVLDPV